MAEPAFAETVARESHPMDGKRGQARGRRLRLNLALLLASLLGTWLFGEIACRTLERAGVVAYVSTEPELQPPFSARLVRSPDPLLFVEHDPADPLLNRAGFRGPAVPEEPSRDTFRILVLGDSVTFGFGVSAED